LILFMLFSDLWQNYYRHLGVDTPWTGFQSSVKIKF